jgi:hypothetical protein
VKDSFYDHMKILLRDFNANVRTEDIFKPTIGNENLHEISNDNGVIVVNFATSKMSKVRRSHIVTFINLRGHLLMGRYTTKINHIDRRRHSSIPDVRSFRAAHCDTDNYLVVAKVRERLAVSKQTTLTFIWRGPNLKKLNEV